jgi:toxin-antitoxin system PIN domain toxin
LNIVDANVLLYATNSRSQQHGPAHSWLSRALNGSEAVGLPWVCLWAFVRISTSRRIFSSPLPVAAAFDIVDTWLDAAPATIVAPSLRHSSILRNLLQRSGSAGNLSTDAHIAALAVEQRAAIATFDRDFERFDVRIHIPQ